MSERDVVPNFFIVGAPKCGTTALSEYLRQHPNVFISDPKEPHYFAEDMPKHRVVTTFDAYMDLFRQRRSEQTAVGEASVWYLYSKVALTRIKAFNPHARILVMLRNPIDFVQSLHAQLLLVLFEDRKNLLEAWNLQEDRSKGRYIPKTCIAPQLLQYRKTARFGDQLERLRSLYPHEQIKCVLHEDLLLEPRSTYLEILEFLGVADDGRREFPRINVRKIHKSQRLAAFLGNPPTTFRMNWRVLKRLFGPRASRIIDEIAAANIRTDQRAPMDSSLRARLEAEFSDDVVKLSEIIDRDLSHWLAPTKLKHFPS